MDWNWVEGNWKEMKGKVKEQWGKLTDDDLDVIAGKQDQLEGRTPTEIRLRERSGPQGNRRLVRSADLVSEGKAPGERGFYWRQMRPINSRTMRMIMTVRDPAAVVSR